MKFTHSPLDSALYKSRGPRRAVPSAWHVIGSQGGVNDRLRYDARNDHSEPLAGAWKVCLSRHGDR
jgi:hypothetical protein